MKSPDSNRSTKTLSPMGVKYFLLVFAISIFFLGRILWPFWSIIILSFLFTNLFRPLYTFFTRRLPKQIASILTCLIITAIVFVPLLIFSFALTGEALSVYHWGRDSQFALKLQTFIQQNRYIATAHQHLSEMGFDVNPEQISTSITYLAKVAGLFLYNQASNWAANILQFVILFFIMILFIFFLLMDMPKLIEYLIKLSPLPDDEDRLLLQKFQEIANAVLKGNGISGIIQGVLCGSVFSIMGLNSPILWGGIMAILAFLPILGIGLVMIPAAIILIANGNIGQGIFLFIFYLILSLVMEYIIKPKFVSNQVKMHTLLVFLSIIGGLKVFGILGIIYGPLIITAFITLSDIYLKNYDDYIQTN